MPIAGLADDRRPSATAGVTGYRRSGPTVGYRDGGIGLYGTRDRRPFGTRRQQRRRYKRFRGRHTRVVAGTRARLMGARTRNPLGPSPPSRPRATFATHACMRACVRVYVFYTRARSIFKSPAVFSRPPLLLLLRPLSVLARNRRTPASRVC